MNFNATCTFGHDHAAAPCPYQHIHDDIDRLTTKLETRTKALRAACDELRQCYEDDGCTAQEIEDQVAGFEGELSDE